MSVPILNSDGTWTLYEPGSLLTRGAASYKPIEGCVNVVQQSIHSNNKWDCGYSTPEWQFKYNYDTQKVDFSVGIPPRTEKPELWWDISSPTSYTQYLNSIVPDKTIKKGYDVYEGDNLTDIIRSDRIMGGGDSKATESCDFRSRPASTIFTTDGETKEAQHRWVDCGFLCSNCDMWPEQSDAPKSTIRGVTAPIGTTVTFTPTEGINVDGGGDELYRCYNVPDSNRTIIGWNKQSFNGDNWKKRLPDDVATGCSSGWKDRRGEYQKTANNYQITHDTDGNITKDDRCFLGTTKIKDFEKIACLKSEIDWGTYCQLGDFISSVPACRENCKGGKCNEAYTRYCTKKIGDPLRRNPDTGVIETSKFNMLDNTSNVCFDYCGTSGDPRCQDIKTELCTKSAVEWKNLDWLHTYCKGFWSKNMNTEAINSVCGASLLDPKGDQNIFSGKGCGTLCEGDLDDVNENYCRSKKKEFCTASDSNMLTENCIKFCTDVKNAGSCDKYLSGVDNTGVDKSVITGMCNRIGIKSQTDLDKIIPTAPQRHYSDLCGCMMSTGFYKDYLNGVAKEFSDLGFSIPTDIDTSPECMYSSCKSGSVMTKEQIDRYQTGFCKNCVQIALNSISDSSLIDSNIVQNQASSCNEIKQVKLLEGYYEIKDTGKDTVYIHVNKDLTYCVYPDLVSLQKDNLFGATLGSVKTIPSGNSKGTNCTVPVVSPGDGTVPPGGGTVPPVVVVPKGTDTGAQTEDTKAPEIVSRYQFKVYLMIVIIAGVVLLVSGFFIYFFIRNRNSLSQVVIA